jgi:hypothetical protein
LTTKSVTLALLIFCAAPAHAYVLTSGQGDSAYVTGLGKGTKALGLDAMFVVSYGTAGPVSYFSATVIGALNFQYFVKNNLSVGFDLSPYYRHVASSSGAVETKQSEYGGIGFINVRYHWRLGKGFFLRPGIGLGGYGGNHITPIAGAPPGAPNQTSSVVYGGAAAVQVGLVYFPGTRFALHAVPTLLVTAGADSGLGSFRFSLDGGFTVGFGYYF